jgi:hypothetical protein
MLLVSVCAHTSMVQLTCVARARCIPGSWLSAVGPAFVSLACVMRLHPYCMGSTSKCSYKIVIQHQMASRAAVQKPKVTHSTAPSLEAKPHGCQGSASAAIWSNLAKHNGLNGDQVDDGWCWGYYPWEVLIYIIEKWVAECLIVVKKINNHL